MASPLYNSTPRVDLHPASVLKHYNNNIAVAVDLRDQFANCPHCCSGIIVYPADPTLAASLDAVDACGNAISMAFAANAFHGPACYPVSLSELTNSVNIRITVLWHPEP